MKPYINLKTWVSHARLFLARIWARLYAFTPLVFPERAKRQAARLQETGLFDGSYYLQQLPEGMRVDNAAIHFIYKGWQQNFLPHPLFDSTWYLQCYPDVAAAHVNPLLHYLRIGWVEGRQPNSLFDGNWYRREYPEVDRIGGNPLSHYLKIGCKKGFDPGPTFSTNCYLEKNRDVQRAGLNPLVHFCLYGRDEGRRCSESTHDVIVDRLTLVADRADRETIDRNLGDGLLLSAEKRSVVVGVVLYETKEDEVVRLLASTCRDKSVKMDVRFLLRNNGGGGYSRLELKGSDSFFDKRNNVGFARGHNELMKDAFSSGADYYVAVNPDGFMYSSCLSHIIAMAEADDGKSLVEAISFPDEHPKVYDPQTFETGWCSGACLCIPSRIWTSIGGFDENLFIYSEDVDYSWRARLAGFRCLTCPQALYFHDIVDRVFEDWRRACLFLSARYLGRKYGDADFAHKYDLLFQSVKSVLPASARAMMDAMPTDVIDGKGVADFEHELLCFPARW